MLGDMPKKRWQLMKPSMPHQKYGRTLTSSSALLTLKAMQKRHETIAAANARPSQPSRAIVTILIDNMDNLLLMLLWLQRVIHRYALKLKETCQMQRKMAGPFLIPYIVFGQASGIGML